MCPPDALPVAGVFIAIGGALQFRGGAVSAVLQHVIGQVCEQLVQLQKKKSTQKWVEEVAEQQSYKVTQLEKLKHREVINDR